MKLYCGVSERVWNHHPVMPGLHACVAPVSGKTQRKHENWVTIPDGTTVIQDSGAFSDSYETRLSFQDALTRQIEHAEKHGYRDLISHRASYDLLIDEMWINGTRTKRRWSENDAENAIAETVVAARFIATHAPETGLILSAQGVTPEQYFNCAVQVIEYIRPEFDMLGLGGWCIVGLHRSLMSSFLQTINLVIPHAADKGVKQVHIWGVLYAPAIARLAWLCDQHSIELSTDSVGPHLRPALGRWGYADWIDSSYKKPSNETLGLHRAEHVRLTRNWLESVRTWTEYRQSESVYVPEKAIGAYKQMALF